MKITICMGSACFLKGSKEIIDALMGYVAHYGLKDEVVLCGAFCMGRCGQGVSVDVDGEVYSVQPENVEEFFNKHVLEKLGKNSAAKSGVISDKAAVCKAGDNTEIDPIGSAVGSAE